MEIDKKNIFRHLSHLPMSYNIKFQPKSSNWIVEWIVPLLGEPRTLQACRRGRFSGMSLFHLGPLNIPVDQELEEETN